MKSGRKIWLLAAAVALIIVVVVVLVVLLPSDSGPSGTPTPTYTAPPGSTATWTVGPNQTDSCNIYFNRSSFTVGEGDTFAVEVSISNVEYLVSGQFDVLYDRNILNVASDPSDGRINDNCNRAVSGNPVTGCGWQSAGPVYSNGIDIGYGSATASSGCLRVLWTNDWVQETSFEGDCAGGDGTGQCGDGWITIITFKAISSGTCEIAFGGGPQGGKLQVNQIKDWVIYQDYSFDATDVIWGTNVQVTVE